MTGKHIAGHYHDIDLPKTTKKKDTKNRRLQHGLATHVLWIYCSKTPRIPVPNRQTSVMLKWILKISWYPTPPGILQDYASASWHRPTGQLQVVQDFSHQYFNINSNICWPNSDVCFCFGEHMFMAFLGRCCTYKITETLAFHISKLYFVFSSLLVSDETEVKPLSLNLNIKLSIYKAIIKRQRVLPLYFPRLGMLWKIQHWQLKTSASACSVCPGRRGRRWRGRWGTGTAFLQLSVGLLWAKHAFYSQLAEASDTSHLEFCSKKILILLERAAFQNALM